MDFMELNCRVNPVQPYTEIVISRLAEMGFEMFEETEEGLRAYIQSDQFNKNYENEFHDLRDDGVELSFEEQLIPSRNWNEVWESNFEPVIINDEVYIHATFHELRPEFRYSIVIQPKMAFGTGHHATTSLVMEQLLNHDISGMTVMDMGCGTGILAILARMRGATEITAIDNDPVASENAVENCRLNNAADIMISTGDASAVKENSYDLFLANINRNIILQDIGSYVKGMKKNGLLVLSGFYIDDIPMISSAALSLGLVPEEEKEKNRWCCLVFRKS